MVTRLGLLVTCLALLTSCGDGASTTTAATSPPTAVDSPTSVPGGSPGGTATTATSMPEAAATTVEFSLPEFTIVERTPEDVLVVAVAPDTYTDIDLRNLVEVVVESFAPVNGLHIVDDEAMAQLVLAEEVTEAEQEQLDEHYFLRLEDGFRMVFLGPFAEFGQVILGS